MTAKSVKNPKQLKSQIRHDADQSVIAEKIIEALELALEHPTEREQHLQQALAQLQLLKELRGLQ